MQTAQDPKPGRNGNRPPVQHQFKPGQSGNPGGRPKRVFTDLVHAYMLSNNQELAREFVRDLVKSARSGNRTAISFIVNRLDNLHLALGPESYEPPDFDADAEAFEKDRIERAEQEAKDREAWELKQAAQRLIWDSMRGQLVPANQVAARPATPPPPADEEEDYDDDEDYEEDDENYDKDEEYEDREDDEDDEESEADDPADACPDDPTHSTKDQGPGTEGPNDAPPPTEPVDPSELYGRPGGRRGPTHTAPNEFAKYANGPWIDV